MFPGCISRLTNGEEDTTGGVQKFKSWCSRGRRGTTDGVISMLGTVSKVSVWEASTDEDELNRNGVWVESDDGGWRDVWEVASSVEPECPRTDGRHPDDAALALVLTCESFREGEMWDACLEGFCVVVAQPRKVRRLLLLKKRDKEGTLFSPNLDWVLECPVDMFGRHLLERMAKGAFF